MANIQIRNVPDNLHRKLKARAALIGLSLSDYLLHEIEEIAARPTFGEMAQRIRERGPVYLTESPADVIRAERDSR